MTTKSCMTSDDPLSPVQLFKCLADDTRARVMFLIQKEKELCVCELTCALDQSQPKISRHLAQLRGCGLLADRRQGQWVYYSLHPDLPSWVRTVLEASLPAHEAALLADATRLRQMSDRPQRAAACC